MPESSLVTFNFYLGDNKLFIEASITMGRPEQPANLDGPGEPAEDPDIEIQFIGFTPPNAHNGENYEFDADTVWVKNRQGAFTPVLKLIEEQALEEFTKWSS
jgi:hypothetical protein